MKENYDYHAGARPEKEKAPLADPLKDIQKTIIHDELEYIDPSKEP